MRTRIIPYLVMVVVLQGAVGLQAAAEGRTTGVESVPAFTPSEALGPVVEARPGADEVLDLDRCVGEALRANDALQAERMRMDELEGQKDQALSTGLPTLDLVGNWTRSRDPSFALDSTFGGGGGFAPPAGSPDWFTQWLSGFGSLIPEATAIPAQSFLRTNLNLSWTLNPVKVSGAVGAARLGIDRQQLSLRATENLTTESTVAAYHGIIKAADRIQAVQARLANQRELLDIMTLRCEMGLATRLDTLQASVALANLRPQLGVAQATLRNEGARLNSLMGRDPGAPLSIANDQVLELEPITDRTALALAGQRPELAAGALFTDILRRNRKAQAAERYPYLTVNGSYGYVGKEMDTLFDPGHDSWYAAVAVNWKVFDGLLTRGLVGQSSAQIRRSESELAGQRRQAQVEVMELLANLRLARQVLQAVLLNQVRSEEVLDESLLMLQLGKTSYLDVLVAEANRAEARSNVIDARFQVLTLTAALKRALGQSPLTPLAAIPGLVAEEN